MGHSGSKLVVMAGGTELVGHELVRVLVDLGRSPERAHRKPMRGGPSSGGRGMIGRNSPGCPTERRPSSIRRTKALQIADGARPSWKTASRPPAASPKPCGPAHRRGAAREGSALPKMALPARLFAGSKLGSRSRAFRWLEC